MNKRAGAHEQESRCMEYLANSIDVVRNYFLK